MSNIAELRALEEFLMGEEDLENVVKEVDPPVVNPESYRFDIPEV